VSQRLHSIGSLAGAGLLGLSVLGTVVVLVVRFTALQERSARFMGLAGIATTVAVGCAAVGLLGALVVLWAGRSRPFAMAAVLPVVVALQMASPTLGGLVSPERAGEGTPLTVLVQNVWYRNADLESAARSVLAHDATVIVLIEYTPEAGDAFHAAASIDRYPFRWEVERPFGRGIAVLSRVPFSEPVDLGLSGPGAVLGLQVGAVDVALYAVHVNAPGSVYDLPRWQSDMSVLTAAVQAAGSDTVVAGDMNATTGHRRFRSLSRAGDLRDAQDAGGGGFAGTWPAHRGVPPLLRIDHVLVGPGLGIESFRTLDPIGSDHLGVLAGLRVPRP